MLAFMPAQSSNSSPGLNYWYGSGGSLPDALEGLPPNSSNPRLMRRASEAVVQASGIQIQEPSEWDEGQGSLHLDTNRTNLVIRPQAASAAANHKAPLAPKQGLGGALANARGQHHSPIAGTYALRTPRGKITSIACESCRKRKSKCDGVRPKCNTCQSKNLTCVYDVAEDGKTTTQLRAHVRRLAKELEDMKSIVSLLAMAPDRVSAASWASELERNGFAHHSAEDIKKALSVSGVPASGGTRLTGNQESLGPTPALPDGDSFGTPSSEPFVGASHHMGTSSYGESSRQESREHSHSSLAYSHDNAVVEGAIPTNPAPHTVEASTNALNKFGFDCAFYQRTKRDLIASGWNEEQIFGRSEIDVDTVLLCFLDPQDAQPVSTWCARTVNRLLPTASMPVRLASTWLLTKVMRYLIWPSQQTINNTPDWLRPQVGKQEASPYDMLVDLVPWPQVRQLLYQHRQEYNVIHLVGLIGITWPYADDACHYWDIETGYSRMTPLYESTVADLNNWTIDPKILEIMPQLEGHIPLKTMGI
ncbi:Zn-clus multi-domain protein [Pyrenophora tritici-repentis]|nr:Zn-clus multi-domain protein [Pyrenophora tritici-repentis]KAI0575626.1 Zn-clus multi-domain protein [Pyrenophora tritici-repentis]KAI1531728.1 Zn-clus multi-domain protein [Pyrenophora tritici-repentis]KAI1586636.1 Zn-clus multi-domain protein [Pyrenophora tritici-repentis]PZC93969.1 Zn-clus multi-domain protein [Pyrenophora tritici-repentis]